MCDIESVSVKLGVLPTTKKPDGSPWYTLPVIQDTNTGVCLADSLPIAEYLEKAFPDMPSLFPHNTNSLQAPFFQACVSNFGSLWKLIIPATVPILNNASVDYFRVTRANMFGVKSLDDVAPQGDAAEKEWDKVLQGWSKIGTWYAKNGGQGTFILGETPSWADMVVIAFLLWMKAVWGSDSEEWKAMLSRDEGFWIKLLEAMSKYTTIV